MKNQNKNIDNAEQRKGFDVGIQIHVPNGEGGRPDQKKIKIRIGDPEHFGVGYSKFIYRLHKLFLNFIEAT